MPDSKVESQLFSNKQNLHDGAVLRKVDPSCVSELLSFGSYPNRGMSRWLKAEEKKPPSRDVRRVLSGKVSLVRGNTTTDREILTRSVVASKTKLKEKQ